MRAVERVVGRLLVRRPEPVDDGVARARRTAALAELRLELRHGGTVLLADGLAQIVGARTREARDLLGDLHGLLLVQDHAVRRADDRLQPRVGEGHCVRVALAPRVRGDLVHGARAVQRVERDEVVELRRADLAQRLLHALGLELEHAHRVAPREHLVRTRVVERQGRHVGPLAGGPADDVEGVLDDVEVAQAQEVHLEEAELLDGLHGVLRHGPVDALTVLPRARVGQLQRDDVGQRAIGDDDGRSVDRRVADDPLEALGDVDDLLRRRVGVVGHLERLALAQAVLEARRPAHDRVGDELGQTISRAVVVPEHAGGVTVAARGNILPKVTICATDSRPYFWVT